MAAEDARHLEKQVLLLLLLLFWLCFYLAPCRVTKQLPEAKKLCLSNGQRHAQLIQSDHTLEFTCGEGYTLTNNSVRKCVNRHMAFHISLVNLIISVSLLYLISRVQSFKCVCSLYCTMSVLDSGT